MTIFLDTIFLIYQVYDIVFSYKNRILEIKQSILVIKKSNLRVCYQESDFLLAINNEYKMGSPFNVYSLNKLYIW